MTHTEKIRAAAIARRHAEHELRQARSRYTAMPTPYNTRVLNASTSVFQEKDAALKALRESTPQIEEE